MTFPLSVACQIFSFPLFGDTRSQQTILIISPSLAPYNLLWILIYPIVNLFMVSWVSRTEEKSHFLEKFFFEIRTRKWSEFLTPFDVNIHCSKKRDLWRLQLSCTTKSVIAIKTNLSKKWKVNLKRNLQSC